MAGWFIAFLLLLFIEVITVNLVSIWFALGALAGLLVAAFSDSLVLQIVVFLIISTISLLVTKPILKKIRIAKFTPTNMDRVIGMCGDVTEKIESNKYGQVKIYGNTWTAVSDEELDVGTRVKAISIDGVKLIVKKEEK